MIRSANHSSYPRVGESPLDQQIRRAVRRQAQGRITAEDRVVFEDEVTTLVVADQARAFVDIVTDGMVRWDGPHSHLARHLDGLETRELRRWFHTNFYDKRLAIVGEIRRREPFLLRDHQIAAGVALHRPVKIVLPGPVSVARMAGDEHYGGLEPAAEALAAALAAEVTDLAAAGVRFFQLDEPQLCRHPEDLDLVARTARTVFQAATDDSTTILGTYFGDLSASADRLAELPGTHLGLDLVTGPANFDLLAGLPDGRGVALGLFDATTTRQEDAAEVAARLVPHRDALICRDVIVGPNAGLDLLPRDLAFDKLLHARYLVETLSKEWTWAS